LRDAYDDVRSASHSDIFYAKINGIWSVQKIKEVSFHPELTTVVEVRHLTPSEAQAMEKSLPEHAPKPIGENSSSIDFEDRGSDVLVVL
jgi:hypothetical protein